VQVGAYANRAGAEELSRKLTGAGHSALITSDAKFHRVFVRAGSTGSAASALAARLDKSGFPGAFPVSPKTGSM
jgi:cell division protein FtsN